MTQASASSELPHRVGEVSVRRARDGAAIYDPASGRLHRLDPWALAIWELCDGETTIDELVAALVELTEADESDVRRDLQQTVKTLHESGLVE